MILKNNPFKSFKILKFGIIIFFLGSIFLIYISKQLPENSDLTFSEVIKYKIIGLHRKVFYDIKTPLSFDKNKIEKLDIPLYKILIKEKEIKYFKNLWKNYESTSSKRSDYYTNNRKWVKVKNIVKKANNNRKI